MPAKNWKTKLFGDNSLNFYGWLFAGLLVFGASAYYVFRALHADQHLSSEDSLLLAIYLLLVGLFGVAWQNYLARVAEKLEAPNREIEEDKVPLLSEEDIRRDLGPPPP